MNELQPNCLRIIQNHEMVDTIRYFKHSDSTVETFRDYLGVSRTTADKMIGTLKDNRGENLVPVSEKQERKIVLRRDAALFLGISIGSCYIRASLIGLDFEPLKYTDLKGFSHLAQLHLLPGYEEQESGETSFTYKVPDNGGDIFDYTRGTVSCIVGTIMRQVKEYYENGGPVFPLMGIGVAVTGPVDYAGGIWCFAPRITQVRDITIVDLMGYENIGMAEKYNIFLSFDNNAKAAIVSEYQFLKECTNGSFNDDIALLYIGTGVGSAAVIGQKLLRGSHNMAGEVGHLKLQISPSDAKTIEECLASDMDYSYILPYVLTAINCMLGVEHAILIGHSMKKNAQLIPRLMENRINYTLSSTQRYCKPSSGRGVPETAAIGAAIEAYCTMCQFNTMEPSKKINLAVNISWGC